MSIDNINGFWLVLAGFLLGWIVEFVFDSIWLRRIESRFQQDMHDLTVELEQNESAVRGMRERVDGLERQLNSEEIRREKLERDLDEANRAKAELADTKNRFNQTEADLHRANIQSDNLNSLLVAAKSSATKSDETLTELRAATELKERSLAISNTRVEVLEEQLTEANSKLEVFHAGAAQQTVDLRVLNSHRQESESLRRLISVKDQEIDSLKQQVRDSRVEPAVGVVVPNTSMHPLDEPTTVTTQTAIEHHNNNGSSVIIPAVEQDDFTRIKGIGTKYAKSLYESGTLTFGQLAQLAPERVDEIINPQFWQVIDPASWIADAAVLAQQKSED